MTETFKQIIALLLAENIPFDITKKNHQWYLYHDDLWDISDVYESQIFSFPRLSTFTEIGHWVSNSANNYIIKIKAVEKSVK